MHGWTDGWTGPLIDFDTLMRNTPKNVMSNYVQLIKNHLEFPFNFTRSQSFHIIFILDNSAAKEESRLSTFPLEWPSSLVRCLLTILR